MTIAYARGTVPIEIVCDKVEELGVAPFDYCCSTTGAFVEWLKDMDDYQRKLNPFQRPRSPFGLIFIMVHALSKAH